MGPLVGAVRQKLQAMGSRQYFTRNDRLSPLAERPDLTSSAETVLGRRIVYFLAITLIGIALGLAATRIPLLFLVGLLGGVVCLVLILMRPYVGLLIYTALFILRLGELYPVLAKLRLELVIGVITFAGIFLNQYLRTGRLQMDSSKQTKFLLFFMVSVLLSVPFSYYRTAAVGGLTETLRVVVFYIMIVLLLNSRKTSRYFVWLFCLLMVHLAFTALRGYYSGHAGFAQGIARAEAATSMGNNPNELGTTCASAIPIFFLVMAVPRSGFRRRLLLGASAVVLLMVLIYTGSRASFLGFLAGCTCLWWLARRKALMGSLGVCLLLAGLYMLPEEYKGRYRTIASAASGGEIDGSSHSRIETWKDGLRMVMDRPLFGVGISCFSAAHGQRDGFWLNSHSLYVQVLAELGIVGAIAFFGFLIEVIRLNRRTARRMTMASGDWSFEKATLNAILAGLVVLFVSGIFGHSLMRRTWYVYAAVSLSIARIYQQREDLDEESLDSTKHAVLRIGQPA